MVEPKIDFAIITAIKVEREAVCKAFQMINKHRVRKEMRVYWHNRLRLKDRKYYEIVVTQLSDMANVDAALATSDIVKHWKPEAVLMVGIAGAAGEGVQLGDLVIGKEIYYYERGKEGSEGLLPEPYMHKANALLFQEVLTVRKWKSLVSVKRPDRTEARPEIHYGVIASGEKVIANAEIRDEIAAKHRKIEAIEMEGYGVSAAAWNQKPPVPCLVIRAISDLGDASKNKEWQPYAAAVAAGFTKHFLLGRPLEPRNPPLPPNQNNKIKPAYKPIIEAFKSGNVVPFLGPGIHLCDSPSNLNNQSSQCPSSEIELASKLSQEIKKLTQESSENNSMQLIEDLMGVPCLFCHVDIEKRPPGCPIRDKIEQKSGDRDFNVRNCPLAIQQQLDLAKMNIRFLSQHYAIMTSSGVLYNRVKEILRDAKPNHLHQFFATLPKKMKQAGHKLPYRLIVTTNYDNLLEDAFCEAKQPFDVVFYVVGHQEVGRFMHRRYRQQEETELIVPQETKLIEDANQYDDFLGKTYSYPVILKLFGSLKDEDFVITEDHYMNYLLNNNLEKIIPTGLRKQLKRSSILFLGYSFNDYDLQLILHKNWSQRIFDQQKSSWFIHRSEPGAHEQQFWNYRHVKPVEDTLENCLTQLEKGLKQEIM